jgi:hypothetical protein
VIALVAIVVWVSTLCFGYWRLCRWRDAEEHTRAAEINRCKAACERP